MILDEFATPFTRAWCIFEVVQTLLLETEDPGTFTGLLLCTESGVLNTGQGSFEVGLNLARRMATLDLAKAQATSEEDKEMIGSAVVELLGSYDHMHQLVHHRVRQMLEVAHTKANNEFAGAFALLDESDVSAAIASQSLVSAEMALRRRSCVAHVQLEEDFEDASSQADETQEIELATMMRVNSRRYSGDAPLVPRGTLLKW